MFYFSEKTILESFAELKGKVNNQLFGLLSILRLIDTANVQSNRPYRISKRELSAWLDEQFYFGSQVTSNLKGGSVSIKFSKKWLTFVKENFIAQGISIYPLAIFVFKYRSFENQLSKEEILDIFCKEFHLDLVDIKSLFTLNYIDIQYTQNKVGRSQLNVALNANEHTIVFSPGSSYTKANAGELTRGPFFQPLYSSINNLKCLMIMMDDEIGEYYDGNENLNKYPKTFFGGYGPFAMQFRFLSALRTKPFMLLAGISGTGKSRNVRKLAQATVTEKLQRKYDPEYNGTNFEEDRWKLHKPANFEIIQVKPNWHNSMDVVGYLSNIPEPHYVFTPFVHFIVKAWQNPDVPFFLCLDEMNLAPVEEYFAEYLSAIESRSFENEEYETDPIIQPFKEFGKKVCEKMLDELLPGFKASQTNGEGGQLVSRLEQKGLTLPQNLIVIGTVNMDETTFSFSRKVLDRAMSIEMNEVDYEKFILGATDDDIKNLCAQIGTAELNRLLVNRHIEAEQVIPYLGGTMEGSDTLFVINYLECINKLLEGTPFKLGYRASNEALIYLAAAKDFGCQSNSAAMDDFTLMKILSRIEGDESKLKLTNSAFDQERLDSAGVNKDEAEKHGGLTLLTALREIIKNHLGEYQQTDAKEEEPQAETETQDSDAADDANKEVQAAKPALLRSIRKIDSMISQLERDHFVSYWN